MKSLFLILASTLIGAGTMVVRTDAAVAARAVSAAAAAVEGTEWCCPEWLCRLLGCCDPCPPGSGACCSGASCCGG